MIVTLSTGVFRALNVTTYESPLEPSTAYLESDLEAADNWFELKRAQAVCDEVWNAFDYDAYYRELAKVAVQYLKDNLQGELDCLPFPLRILDAQAHIYRPREYNFRGDDLEFDVSVRKDVGRTRRFRKWMDESFDDAWMRRIYGSWDGFCSFMPWTREEMEEAFEAGDPVSVGWPIAMIATQCLRDADFDFEEFQRDFEDGWSEDGSNEMVNYLKGDTPLLDAFEEERRRRDEIVWFRTQTPVIPGFVEAGETARG